MGRLCVAVCLIFFGGKLRAQQAATPTEVKEEKNWKQVCRKATAAPVETLELKGPLAAGMQAHCDETALYYGIGKAPDYAAALECGWYERAHPQPSVGNMFYGPGVLTMLYANGLGVPRNLALALRFACENTWAADAEMEGRVGHLEALRDGGAATAKFDLCDDITSGLSMGTCTNVQTSTEDAARAKKVAAIRQALPVGARGAFAELEKAEAAFEETRVRNEIDLSGTARGMFQLADQTKLRDQFVINLKRFGKGDIPAASAGDVAKLEKQMASAYAGLQAAPPGEWYGTVKPEGIAKTQQAWTALLDAWMKFVGVAYPGRPEPAVRAQLIRLRVHQLRSLEPRG